MTKTYKQVSEQEFNNVVATKYEPCPYCNLSNCSMNFGSTDCGFEPPQSLGYEIVHIGDVVNVTQHQPTSSQRDAGVTDFSPEVREELLQLLNIPELENGSEMTRRAAAIVNLCKTESEHWVSSGHPTPAFMLGGHPALTAIIHQQMDLCGMKRCYAFSRRESVESTDVVTGAVSKQNVFLHLGFTWFF